MLLGLTTALLLLLGGEIVVLLYGAKWATAGTTLRILALLVFCRGHAVLISPLLVSIRGNAPDAKIKVVEAAVFLALLYPLTSRFGGVGAAWAGTIAFFVAMINRLYIATSLLPNISKTILRTILCSVAAVGAGVGLGALAILRVESVTGRFLVGGAVIAIVVTGVMMVLSPQLRAEMSQLFWSARARRRAGNGA
jgi:O-antigen/teichoic acid export membrane protein